MTRPNSPLAALTWAHLISATLGLLSATPGLLSATPGAAAAASPPQLDEVWSATAALGPVTPAGLAPSADGEVAGLFLRGTAPELRRFNENGDLQWSATPGGALSDAKRAFDVGPAGELFVGTLDNGKVVLSKFMASGQLEWERDLFSPAPGYPFEKARLDVDDAGSVAVACTRLGGPFFDEHYTTTFRFDSSGALLWTSSELGLDDPLVSADSGGHVTVALRRNTYDTGPYSLAVRRYDNSGAELWTVDPALGVPPFSAFSESSSRQLLDGPNGEVYFMWATTALSEHGYVSSISATGALNWTWRAPGLQRANPIGMGLDALGRLVVAIQGERAAPNAPDDVVSVTMLDAFGAAIWTDTVLAESEWRPSTQVAVQADGSTAVLVNQRTYTQGQAAPTGWRLALYEWSASGAPSGPMVLRDEAGQTNLSFGLYQDRRGNLLVLDRELTPGNPGPSSDAAVLRKLVVGGEQGLRYCSPGAPNSTGAPATLRALGASSAAENNVTLIATNLPASAPTLFLIGSASGNVAGAGGSQGTLCVGGLLGRYARPGEVRAAGAGGTASLQLEFTRTPTASGVTTITAGQTWFFQGWHRDANPGPTSNFTDAIELTFQ